MKIGARVRSQECDVSFSDGTVATSRAFKACRQSMLATVHACTDSAKLLALYAPALQQ